MRAITQNGNVHKDFDKIAGEILSNLWSNDNSIPAHEFLLDNVLILETSKLEYIAGVLQENFNFVGPCLTYSSDYLTSVQDKEDQENQLALFYDDRISVRQYPRW